jgi:hypothetical protein
MQDRSQAKKAVNDSQQEQKLACGTTKWPRAVANAGSGLSLPAGVAATKQEDTIACYRLYGAGWVKNCGGTNTMSCEFVGSLRWPCHVLYRLDENMLVPSPETSKTANFVGCIELATFSC